LKLDCKIETNILRKEDSGMIYLKRGLLILAVGAAIAGCSQNQQALQEKCNGGDKSACEELAQNLGSGGGGARPSMGAGGTAGMTGGGMGP